MKCHNIGLVIVDGVGFRNFVLSDLIKNLKNNNCKIIIYSGLKEDVYSGIIPDGCKIIELPIYKETNISWGFRKLKEIAHLQAHKEHFSIANNLKNRNPKTNNVRGFVTRGIIKLTSVLNSEKWINLFYKLQCFSFKNDATVKEYQELLSKEEIEILFFSHQRPAYIAPLAYLATKLNIPTSSFIFSWDNLASKGRMAASFDTFFVWSNLMKKELLHFYPSITKEQIFISGTPQFEPYSLERYNLSKTDFINYFNITNDNKIICYSCGDASTSKNDSLYIETIAKAIKEQTIAPVNFIVRTSPAEDGSRFKELKEKYPNIIWNFPQWKLTREDHPETWSQRVPDSSDLKILKALIKYCDLNINVCSTMSLDFMLFDKPVINPVFGTTQNSLDNDQRFLKYGHYKHVVESGAVAISKNEAELINEINFSLKNPKYRLQNQRNLINLQIGQPIEGTTERIALKLISLT